MGADPSTAELARLFEGASGFVDRLIAEPPVGSWDELLERAEQLATEMREEDQVELINSHPRIGATPETVSAQSYREQGYDRDPGSLALDERLARLNSEYESRFGFRFVVFVAGRPRSEIADVMEARMAADRSEERHRALSDVFAIARDRLKKQEAR